MIVGEGPGVGEVVGVREGEGVDDGVAEGEGVGEGVSVSFLEIIIGAIRLCEIVRAGNRVGLGQVRFALSKRTKCVLRLYNVHRKSLACTSKEPPLITQTGVGVKMEVGVSV